MVLAELGSKLTRALGKMKDVTVLDEGAITDMLKDIQRALLEADVQAKLVKQMTDNIRATIMAETETAGFNKRKLAQTAVVSELRKLLDPQTKPYAPKRGKPNVVCFVGLQGSGKTTTVTKYALYYQKKGYKTGVVCADTFRAGAYDQLRQNAMKAKVQFYGSITESDPVQIAAEGVEKFKKDGMEIIVVDTSGRHKQEEALFQEMEQVVATVKPDDIVFTLDSSIGQAAFAQAEAFKSRVDVGSVIITKLDGHAKGGGAISAVSATKSPITFIGTGEHFEEFEVFSSSSFVSRLLGMGDVQGLVDKIQTAGIDQNTALYNRMTEGDFTMRDMYEHLENVLKLGPMGSFMDMLPGLPQGMFKGNREKESTAMLRTFLTIIDSMTEKEKDSGQIKKLMVESRIKRLARGSGRNVQEVNDMLKTYTKFEEMVKKIGKMRFKQMAKDPSALLRNNSMNQFAKAIDPRVLQQMGGAGGLQKMIKQFSQGGGADMAKMFGM